LIHVVPQSPGPVRFLIRLMANRLAKRDRDYFQAKAAAEAEEDRLQANRETDWLEAKAAAEAGEDRLDAVVQLQLLQADDLEREEERERVKARAGDLEGERVQALGEFAAREGAEAMRLFDLWEAELRSYRLSQAKGELLGNPVEEFVERVRARHKVEEAARGRSVEVSQGGLEEVERVSLDLALALEEVQWRAYLDKIHPTPCPECGDALHFTDMGDQRDCENCIEWMIQNAIDGVDDYWNF
jgi:hypothetical protein